MQETK